MSTGRGTKSAVDTALAERPAADETPEMSQLELLGLPADEPKVVLARAQTGKIGRPLGARNRRTIEFAHYLLNRYTSPLEVLAQIASAGTAELAGALGCTKLEALQERRLAAIALKDHLHSKMPIAVDVNSHKIIHLTIGSDPEIEPHAGDDESGDVLSLTATVIKDAGDDAG